MTYQDLQWHHPYDDLYHPHQGDDSNEYGQDEDAIEPETIRLIAAAIASHKRGKFTPRKPSYNNNNSKQSWSNPWSLPPDVWNYLTPEQKKLWMDLKEAARVRNTGSGAPPFQTQGGKAQQYGGVS